MSIEELAAELANMHREGIRKREGNASLVLFGIKYAEYLGPDRAPIEAVIVQSGIRRDPTKKSYNAEIGVGKQLARYVQLK